MVGKINIAKMSRETGVPEITLRRRYKKGLRGDELLQRQEGGYYKPIMIGDVQYKSIKDAAKGLGVTVRVFRRKYSYEIDNNISIKKGNKLCHR